MFRELCFLTFVLLTINYTNCWDIAITAGDQLELYTNNTKIDKEGLRLTELTALAYDAVHNMLLFVDKQNDNASIFSYHLVKKKFQPLVRRKVSDNIQGLAFDPVKSLLFWTDYNDRSIMWMSLLPGSKSNAYGSLLIKTDRKIPRALVVDSCRGYIYWTNIYPGNATIERMRFDGSEIKEIVNRDIISPTSIAIDQQERKIYWSDNREGIHYSIESSDLDGNQRKTLYSGINHIPNALTVSKDLIFWTDWGYKTVWQFPKNAKGDSEPVEVTSFKDINPFGIVSNYDIEDQIRGITECNELGKLAQNKTAINDTFKTVKRNEGLFCLHGEKIEDKWACRCTLGYIGERCETSVCQNFCFNGDCTLTTEGKPHCKCTVGYKGDRCEISNICDYYCLNNGHCKLDSLTGAPLCKCISDYVGSRCEFKANTIQSRTATSETCNCTKDEKNTKEMKTSETLLRETTVLESAEGLYVEGDNNCSPGWDPLRDPVIMVLGTLSGLLCVLCAILATKIMQLKKRPRIKKRIIVNKNVTPLTARPDQCEITIENCCNMNICETPCFEPRSIRPSLLETRSGKDEKKNLISNMEHPDDLY